MKGADPKYRLEEVPKLVVEICQNRVAAIVTNNTRAAATVPVDISRIAWNSYMQGFLDAHEAFSKENKNVEKR